jgi:GNAT superfamily N-acetyltransferase
MPGRRLHRTATFEPRWWEQSNIYGSASSYVDVRRYGVEVARVALDQTVATDHYPGAPELGEHALEIQLIEVSSQHRRQGIATEVVRRIATAHPDRRLVAFSEEADAFWASLGWDRYDHTEWPTFYRPQFVQPN